VASSEARAHGTGRLAQLFGAGALVTLGLVFVWRSLAAMPLGTAANPGPGAAPLLLAGLLIVAGLWTAVVVAVAAPPRDATEESRLDRPGLQHAAFVIGAAAFAASAIGYLGYRLTVLVVLFFLIGLVERKPIGAALSLSLALAFGTYWVFVRVVKVPLPTGVFGL
jgi:Tripartite tricarboxylate transporter TctB family